MTVGAAATDRLPHFYLQRTRLLMAGLMATHASGGEIHDSTPLIGVWVVTSGAGHLGFDEALAGGQQSVLISMHLSSGRGVKSLKGSYIGGKRISRQEGERGLRVR